MNVYKCLRCGYCTNHKTKYTNHLKRLNKCKNILSNNDLQCEYIKYNIVGKILVKKVKINICKYCNNKYNNKYNLNRHYKSCLIFNNNNNENENENNNENENFKDEMKFLKDEIKNLKDEVKNLKIENKIENNIDSHDNNNTHIQNIFAFNNEDLSHLLNNDYINCFKKSNMCIPDLIYKTHFNPLKPENHNIYISNLQNKYIMIYNGDKWEIKNQDAIIDNLIDKNEQILTHKIEEWIINGIKYPTIRKKVKRYIDQKENDVIKNTIKEDIKLLLFNNKDLIKNYKDLIKK